MARKPLTLRTAVITTTAVSGGSAAGSIIDTLTTELGHHYVGTGQLAAGIVTLWILDKLHHLIDDTK